MGKPFFCSTNPNHKHGGGKAPGRFAWGLPFPESSPEGHLPRVGLILIPKRAASRRGESPPVSAAAQEIAALYLWIMEEATT